GRRQRRRDFFFQAEDGIRDFHVTGVQTCALPIFTDVEDKIIVRARETGEAWTGIIERYIADFLADMDALNVLPAHAYPRATEEEIGRASCREGGGRLGGGAGGHEDRAAGGPGWWR